MPIFSYLAIPREGRREELCAELMELDHCQVIPAENSDIVVLVTDTSNEFEEKRLQDTLKSIDAMHSLSLTFGYDEKEDKGENRQ